MGLHSRLGLRYCFVVNIITLACFRSHLSGTFMAAMWCENVIIVNCKSVNKIYSLVVEIPQVKKLDLKTSVFNT